MENTDERSSVKCNPHPDAPHGFLRDASHNEGRYVCECEFWEPPEEKQKPVAYVTGFHNGHCVIQPTDPAVVLPVGMALYRAPTEWVGLTDEESVSLLVKANKPKVKGQQFTTAPEMAAEFGRLVSELLKERNT